MEKTNDALELLDQAKKEVLEQRLKNQNKSNFKKYLWPTIIFVVGLMLGGLLFYAIQKVAPGTEVSMISALFDYLQRVLFWGVIIIGFQALLYYKMKPKKEYTRKKFWIVMIVLMISVVIARVIKYYFFNSL